MALVYSCENNFLHQKVLYDIADHLPVTEEQLRLIPGIGEKMLEKYGKEILEITTL